MADSEAEGAAGVNELNSPLFFVLRSMKNGTNKAETNAQGKEED